jgi:hypothetical protein
MNITFPKVTIKNKKNTRKTHEKTSQFNLSPCKSDNKKVRKFKNKEFNLRFNIFTKTIIHICQKCDLSMKTFYLSLTIFDLVSSRYVWDEISLKRMAITSLCLASKVAESQKNSLCTKDLKLVYKDPKHDYGHTEKLILKELNFDLRIKTPYDSLVELLNNKAMLNGLHDNLQKKFKKHCKKILYLVSLEYASNSFESDIIGIAILLISRSVFKCNSTDLKKMILKSGYCDVKILLCIKFIVKILQTTKDLNF